MPRVPDAFFFGFTSIINNRFLTNQIVGTISVILYVIDNTFTEVKRNLKFQTRYMKGVPFLSKKVYKGVKGWTLGQSLPT